MEALLSSRWRLRAILAPALLSLTATPASPLLAQTESAASARAIEGTWLPESYSEKLLTIDGDTPPLNEKGAELYRQRSAMKDDLDRQYDRTRWCAGAGMPRIMFLPYPFEIRADGDYVGFIYGWYRWHRMVDMSGREADPVMPQSMGFPVGRWDGDALLIHTIGTTSDTVLDALGLPHSDDMEIRERISLLPDGRLEARFTIEDSEFYTRPWTAAMTYRRANDLVVGDDVCPDRLIAGQPAIRSDLR